MSQAQYRPLHASSTKTTGHVIYVDTYTMAMHQITLQQIMKVHWYAKQKHAAQLACRPMSAWIAPDTKYLAAHCLQQQHS